MLAIVDACCDQTRETSLILTELSNANVSASGNTIVENLSALNSLINTKYESQSYTELEQINLVVSFETFADLFTGLLSTAESKDDILVSKGLKVPICSGFQGLGTSIQGFSTNLENDITIYPQEIRRINAHAAGLLEQHLKVHGRLEEAMVEKIDE